MGTANALTQLHADPHLRGRVMSVYFLVLLGGTPVGAPLAGLVSDALGARATLILGGVVSACVALAPAASSPPRGRLPGVRPVRAWFTSPTGGRAEPTARSDLPAPAVDALDCAHATPVYAACSPRQPGVGEATPAVIQ
ncbi:hypothetical protein ABZ923_12285 [Streptomyces sp. NPDC046881]|uniref:hypothetical protein n=1 Tax=Streptomyces sp. NPDC046881 TaxID=3155374 RepID=UPI0033E89C98